jgi:hypothetical protein
MLVHFDPIDDSEVSLPERNFAVGDILPDQHHRVYYGDYAMA